MTVENNLLIGKFSKAEYQQKVSIGLWRNPLGIRMPDATAKTNLHFATLGIQMGMLSKEQVILAFTKWRLDNSKTLAQMLLDQKALTEEQAGVLLTAVTTHIQKEGDLDKALASLPQIKVLQSDLERLGDQDIQATQEFQDIQATQGFQDIQATRDFVDQKGKTQGLVDTKLTSQPTHASPFQTSGQAPVTKDRFEKQQFFDAGNLGELFFAKDTELNRSVVTKYIKSERANEALTQALFLLEGEVTGALEHPNIVPVYGLGKDSQGNHFYAMRYIRGRKLTKAIEEYQAIPASEAGKKQKFLIGLLQNFQAVCNAIGFAHTKGVLHCDIKPDNIMVGDFGEVFVVDWGLVVVYGEAAKPVPANKKSFSTLDVSQVQPYFPSDSAVSGLHQNQGGDRQAVGGTPAYMAPEQLQATMQEDVSLLGPAADIYALGGTLFQILTGKPPHLSKKNPNEKMGAFHKRILQGDFTRPREWTPNVPKPLEAIVLKAMSLEPGARYASAKDLTEEVNRWLADEPVLADRETLLEKSRRWARKNRTAVAIGAVLLVSLAVGGMGFGFITQGFNEKLSISEKEARDSAVVADTERARAEIKEKEAQTNLVLAEEQHSIAVANEKLAKRRERAAIEAVKQYGKAVSDNPELKNRPELESLRKDLLKEPIRFFKELSDQLRSEKNTTPESLHSLAKGLVELAYLTDEIGDWEDAIGSYKQAIELRESLVKTAPSNTGFQDELAGSQNNLGALFHKTGKVREAQGCYKKALAILETLGKIDPTNTTFSQSLAGGHNNLANLYIEMGSMKDAENSYQKALTIREFLAKANPSDPELQEDLAGSFNNLGILNHQSGRLKEAEENYQKVLSVLKPLAIGNPNNFRIPKAMSDCYNNLGLLFGDTSRLKDAEESYKKAITIRESLVNSNPSNIEFQNDLGSSYNTLGLLFSDTSRVKDAEEIHKKAITIREALAKSNPNNTGFQNNLGSSYNALGFLYFQTGRSKEAEESLLKAVTIRETLAKPSPNNTGFQNNLVDSHSKLGQLYSKAGRVNEAEKSFQKAVSIREVQAKSEPTNTEFQHLLANSNNDLGMVYRNSGRVKEAEESFQKAVTNRESMVKSDPSNPEFQNVLANSHYNLGNLFFHSGRMKDAEDRYKKALDIWIRLKIQLPNNTYIANRIANSRIILCESLLIQVGTQASQLQETQAAFLKLVAADPKNPDFLNPLGAILYRLKDYPNAMANFEKARSLKKPMDGEDPFALAFMAMTYKQLKKPTEAVDYLKKCREVLKKETHSTNLSYQVLLKEAETVVNSKD